MIRAAARYGPAMAPRSLDRTGRASSSTALLATRVETWIVLLSALSLAALGVYAINLSGGYRQSGLSGLAIRQMAFLGFSLLVAVAVAVPHYRRYGPMAWFLLAGAVAALLFLLAPGVPSSIVSPRNGARAWIDLGPMSLQPAEFAKLAVVLALARYLRHRSSHRRFFGFIPPALITFVPMCLIVLQPDLGSAALFAPALLAMLLAAGAKLKHIVLVVVMGAALSVAAYPVLLPHQKERIVAMVNQMRGDTSRADTSQYQSLKAMTLAGAGGVAGLDEPHSRAIVDFNDLPEQHNDMIFAVIVNRFGLLGAGATLGLYLLFLGAGTIVAARCKDPFGRLVAVGVCAFVAAQMIVNVGMCLGVLPIVGVTLPFVSYGGSSILASFVGVGLLVNIGLRPPAHLSRESFEFGDED